MIWQIIIDFLKLLSDKKQNKKKQFLTHYSLYFLLLIIIAWVYFSQPKIPKPVP